MKKKLQKILFPFLIISIVLFVGIVSYKTCNNEKLKSQIFTEINGQTLSEVKTIEGVPTLVINNIPYNKLFLEIYDDTPPNGEYPPDYTKYPSQGWIDSWKNVIQKAVEKNSPLIQMSIKWKDLDQSLVEPNQIDEYFDYTALDTVMDYAKEKGVYIILGLEQHTDHPIWFRKKYDIPNLWTDKNSQCEFCSKDSTGITYDDISDGSEINKKAFSGFITSVVNRYKNHPALSGWSSGLGPSGEDNFAPNYVRFRSPIRLDQENTPEGEYGDRICDYSPVTTKNFLKWLKKKYKTETAVNNAWGINVSFENFSIPTREQVFKNTSKFMDPRFGENNICGSEDYELTSAGMDLCHFKIEARWDDRLYYAKLFKNLDPNHILLMSAWQTEDILKGVQEIDGMVWNINLSWDTEMVGDEADQFRFVMNSIKNIGSYGKLLIISSEGNPSLDSDQNNNNYLTAFGKGVKCNKGLMGYVGDRSQDNNHIYPVWAGTNQMIALNNINAYQVTADCKCKTVKDVYESNGCLLEKNSNGCKKLEGAYKEYCTEENANPSNTPIISNTPSVPNTPITPTPNTSGAPNILNMPSSPSGTCGDKICDETEKTSGMCSLDCY